MKSTFPGLNVVLVEPQIPPNTGNIARLCAATQCHLILLGSLGFELTDRYLKRAGLDYWEWVSWEHIEDAESFLEERDPNTCHFLTTHAQTPYTQMELKENDYLFFGKETAGLPKAWRERYPEQCFTIPMWAEGVRSINLASAVSIALYDGLRQLREF